jgi:hypothetical protein
MSGIRVESNGIDVCTLMQQLEHTHDRPSIIEHAWPYIHVALFPGGSQRAYLKMHAGTGGGTMEHSNNKK